VGYILLALLLLSNSLIISPLYLARAQDPSVDPSISGEDPLDGATGVYTNPELSVYVSDPNGDLMSVVFESFATGSWVEIKSFSGVDNGEYSCIPTDMNQLGTTYSWRVRVSDGAHEVTEVYSFTTTSTVLSTKWTRTGLQSGFSGVLICDTDDDGYEEVIHAGMDYITCIDGRTGTVIWSHYDWSIGWWCQPQMADLTNDGTIEILVPLQEPAGVLVLHAEDGSQYWRITNLGTESMNSPAVQDIDGDGYPEIFYASTDIYTIPHEDRTSRLYKITYNGVITHEILSWRPCAGGIAVADTDGDDVYELYMTDRDMYMGDGGYGKGIQSFWAENLTERWYNPYLLCSSHCPMIDDVDKDGVFDVIVGHMTDGGGLAVLDSRTGLPVGGRLNYGFGLPIHYQPSVYDIDNDGNLEIMCADGPHSMYGYPNYRYEVVVFDLYEWDTSYDGVDARLWTGRCEFGPTVGDVTGDGKMEIIACNYTHVFIFDSEFNLVTSRGPIWEILNYAIIGDIDGDDYNELVVASQSGRVYAFDTPARTWKPRPKSEIQHYSNRRLGAAVRVSDAPLPTGFYPTISDPDPSNGQFGVSPTITTLSFDIDDPQEDLMSYLVVTDPDIGIDDNFFVPPGRYSIDISGVQPDTSYEWTVTVTDGENLTEETFYFTTGVALTDSDFEASVDSDDLRANSTSQDWYESRGAFGGGNSLLLTLDTENVGNDDTKKAALKNYGISENAYLTQEFLGPLAGSFTFSFDVYIDRIENSGRYDRTAHILVGDDSDPGNCPTGEDGERAVYLAFYDGSPGDTGSDLQLRARTSTSERYDRTNNWMEVGSGFEYDKWHRVVINVYYDIGFYEIFVDGVQTGFSIPFFDGYAGGPPTHLCFSADSDGRGDFYIDNVYAPSTDRYNVLEAKIDGSGSVTWDPKDASYEDGTVLTVTAVPDEGGSFLGWSGDLGGTTNPETLIMDDFKEFTAHMTILPLLVDSSFGASLDSDDLRADSPEQDWYESRAAFGGASSALLVHLNKSDVGGNIGKKAGLLNDGIELNAYLTQEFKYPQISTFDVSYDIYIDTITDTPHDATGNIYIGNDYSDSNCPMGTQNERFFYLKFYDSTPGGSGSDMELRARTLDSQPWDDTTTWDLITTGLSYDTWYNFRLVLDIPGGTFDVYIDDVLVGDDVPKFEGFTQTSVTHIAFAADEDWQGEFYVDNVHSPALDFLPPVVSNPNPADGAVDVPLSTSLLTFALSDPEADSMDYYVSTSPDIGSDSASGVSDGAYSLGISGLAYGNEYIWWVNATDGISWTNSSFSFTTNLPPVVSDLEPVDGRAGIPLSTTLLNFTLSDVDGDSMDYYVATIPDVGSDSASGVSDGTFSLGVSGLDYGIEYMWWVNVTDGIHWTNTSYTFITVQPLLVDSSFDASVDSDDLRADSPEQDWYESRAAFGSGGDASLLVLNETDVGGNTGKKAGLLNDGTALNAYLTQEFKYPMMGTFDVGYDIYIDTITDTPVDATGNIYIGNDYSTGDCPLGTANERFFYLKFYDSTPGETGSDLELRARTDSSQDWDDCTEWDLVTSGLSYDTWYNFRLEIDVPGGTYDVYIDDILVGDDVPKYEGFTQTSITHIAFAADSDWQGEYYVDNVYVPAALMPPIVTDVEPVDGATDIPLTTTLLNFTLSDPDGDPMDYYVSTLPDVGSDSATGVSDGDFSLTVTGLTSNTEYTWWVNVTDGISWTNMTYVFTTEMISQPIISNIEPSDGADDVPISTTLLNFTLSDPDGDTMDYYVSTLPDVGSDSATGVIDGAFSLTVSGLTYDTEYTWWVNVTDGFYWTNASYIFTTEPNPSPVVLSTEPSDEAMDVPVLTTLLNFTLSDPNGDLMDYYVSTLPDVGSDSATGVSDGAFSLTVSGLAYDTEYTWWVNVTDGLSWTNMTYLFTTEQLNLPPVASNPEPVDGATDVSVSTTLLNFTLSDPNGDLMDYYVSTLPDVGSDSATGVSDGTFSLGVSGLAYDTEYTWWVNVTDGLYWTNTSYTFMNLLMEPRMYLCRRLC